MMKKLFVAALIFASFQSRSQELVYRSNGNVRDANNNRLSPSEVRKILSSNEKVLAEYNSGRTKKTVGNLLLIGGLGCITADLLVGLTADESYPSFLTFAGGAAVVSSIPVKIGYAKKIKNAVNEHDNANNVGVFQPKLNIFSNKNGVGLSLAFN